VRKLLWAGAVTGTLLLLFLGLLGYVNETAVYLESSVAEPPDLKQPGYRVGVLGDAQKGLAEAGLYRPKSHPEITISKAGARGSNGLLVRSNSPSRATESRSSSSIMRSGIRSRRSPISKSASPRRDPTRRS